MAQPLLESVALAGPFGELSRALPAAGTATAVWGAPGSLGTLMLAALAREHPNRTFVGVAASASEASKVEADLETVLSGVSEGGSGWHLYPQRESLPYTRGESHLAVGSLRVEAVEALLAGECRTLVTSARALQERVRVPEALASLKLTLRRGETHSFSGLASELELRGFERVVSVEEVGQFAVRGGIIDFFSVAVQDPVRVEFWGDGIESIRTFDPSDQLSRDTVREAHLLPVDFEAPAEGGTSITCSLLELLPPNTVMVRLGEHSVETAVVETWKRVEQLHSALPESHRADSPEPGELFVEPGAFLEDASAYGWILLSTASGGSRSGLSSEQTGHEDTPDGGPRVTTSLDLGGRPPPAIERDMSRLEDYLAAGAASGAETLVLSDGSGQLERLEEILGGARRVPDGTTLAIGSLAGGFELPRPRGALRILTDHEIFKRPRRLRSSRRFRGRVAIESLAQLTPGDHVVHMDHGVGRFLRLDRTELGGNIIESLAIEYAGGELLRVPVHGIDRIERWIGVDPEAEPPSLHRIGGRRWRNHKAATEARIAEMTAQLLELHARREATPGFAFSRDTRWQREMESSFLYEDTPDQREASRAVKRDMERARPMDRLVCGDAGYGKTEVAVRATFKAVQDSKQVAFLAPTTILVEQHRHTLGERLAGFPVNIGTLSRFRPPREQREVLAGLAAGRIDVVVGTHRLLSKDVVFKDLGLLIIDEEQRFGVRHKERLKSLKSEVDVLTLSATPIPRTLHLSLSGLRDLSLIRTPPRDRMPVFTHVLPWIDEVVAEALRREMDRGGQAFLLHNRVDTIHTIAENIRGLVPEATVAVAHGQMPAAALDGAMRGFVDGGTDVLVCSSIIENGLDVPNANTLVVDRADRFGLAQLYQIRGRVGRSDRRAYCYLLVPDEVEIEAERRLRVLERHTELGAGYTIALKDLELRGAGDLLGAEQSGFAQRIGLDAYMRLLKRTVARVRGAEGSEQWPEPSVTLDGAAFLPDGFAGDSSQKLHCYRQLSNATSRPEIARLRAELRDRCGRLPPEAERLFQSAALRLTARSAGAETVLVNGNRVRISFREEADPRMAAFGPVLGRRDATLEVGRVEPLSIVVTDGGRASPVETVCLLLESQV